MEFLKKLFGKKREQSQQEYIVQTPAGTLELAIDKDIEKDPDARIDEFWIETIGVSEDGYWVLVGRRHGIIQLYDWSGKLHRLPSRPVAQVISDVVFSGSYLALLTPPYLVIYKMEDPKRPSTWKVMKISQEGIRPSGGLDLKGNVLAFGVVGDRVYTIDVTSDALFQTVEFKSAFSYREAQIGELRSIRILDNSKLVLSGTNRVAIYSIGGNLLTTLDYPSGKALEVTSKGILVANSNRLILYDVNLDREVSDAELSVNISTISIDPSENFAFCADKESNRLSIVYLPEMAEISLMEGFGYSVVKVSPDGSLYTCTVEDVQDKRYYNLVKLNTNLVDFYYPPQRQKQIISNLQDTYKKFLKALSQVKTEEEIENIKEYKELLSYDFPLREVRKLIKEAQEQVDKKRLELFIEKIQKAINNKEITGKDLYTLEERIKHSTSPERETLEKLKQKVLDYFEQELQERLLKIKHALSNIQAYSLQDLETIEDIKEFRAFISTLPTSLQSKAQESLLRTLQEKIVQERLKRYSIKTAEDRVLFGNEEFPKFSGQRRKLNWHLKVEERFLYDGREYARIAFERDDGVLLEPKRYPNILPTEELKHPPLWLRRYLRHLKGLYSYQEYRIPLFVAYEETPWFVQNLEKFVSHIKEQLEYQEGILILEGDAGTGKNFLVEVFSALTNRPLYIVPCNSKMEKEDITFTYEFDAKRGTRRVYSDLVRALQTPGAVIYFDEINTLPASLVKIFNSLFDYRRYLVLSSGEVIKARPDVILVGGMNPQNYLGVSELPQDVKSRADVLFVDYPPFEDPSGFYYPDEALILRSFVPEVSSLTKEDFVYLWYHVINGVPTERSTQVYTPEREKYARRIYEILKIANAIRKAYREYQTQQSEEPVELVFSIRDTIRCARRIVKYEDTKKLVLESMLPKVSSPLEREVIKSLVENVDL
ncbi:ATP-binding protein [Thermocrinis minervae]|uniref:MoxR-like ATPase n=1 Tax=Thermocrinis minervae TaxID=381751 RepID=A0A1M6TM79_9AQUI|nr:AAA family ATPase [Thermocrinis minervae]SHK58016.1 MoxR-like ATPase [Thermocrinis minervae]